MKLLRFALFLMLSVVSTRAGTLSGTVRDPEGAAISNVHIVIHWDSSGSAYLKDNLGIRQDFVATTDMNGHYSVELPPGFYDVFVSATTFSPRCDKLRLRGKENRTYDVKLTVSPVTARELD
jgi:hypothetical protein